MSEQSGNTGSQSCCIEQWFAGVGGGINQVDDGLNGCTVGIPETVAVSHPVDGDIAADDQLIKVLVLLVAGYGSQWFAGAANRHEGQQGSAGQRFQEGAHERYCWRLASSALLPLVAGERSPIEGWGLGRFFFEFCRESDDFPFFLVEGSPEDFAKAAIEFLFLFAEDIDGCFLHAGQFDGVVDGLA